MNRPLTTVLCLVPMLAAMTIGPAIAQPALFGSIDDPAEAVRLARWDRDRSATLMAGFSLIGAQWRSAAAARLRLEGSQGSIWLDGSLRAGIYGNYGPDTDEPYDLLRVIRHVRLDPVGRRFAYLRLGTGSRGRLGHGHLVHFLSNDTAWDERRLGFEMRLGSERLAMYGIASDVRLGDVVGGRLEWAPLAAVRSLVLRSLRLGGSFVLDRSTRHLAGAKRIAAWEADVRIEVWRSGAFALSPFVSAARLLYRGRGAMLGVDLEADNFIDLARVHARLAVHANSDRFVPGYFGPFQSVHGIRSQVLSNGDDSRARAGVAIDDVRSSLGYMTELRVHLFERFEFWYAFTRHFGSQRLSTMHIRMFLRASRFRAGLGQDRGQLAGFFSVFQPLDDLATLVFRAEYRVFGHIWVLSEARYTYERVGGSRDDRRFLVQRRFEPYVGIRMPF